MKLPVRQRPATAPPGLVGTARVERRTRSLLPRLRPGDLAVLDHLDMDRATAQALVDVGVVAVVNASPMISGRYANLGPQVLADAGILLVDGIGTDGLAAIRDGASIRVHEGSVHVGDELVATGREVDGDDVRAEMDQARVGMATQLETFTHNSSEFLRREEDLLLHGRGLPRPSTRIAGRTVVVVVAGHEHESELRRHPALPARAAAGPDRRRAGSRGPPGGRLPARHRGARRPRRRGRTAVGQDAAVGP